MKAAANIFHDDVNAVLNKAAYNLGAEGFAATLPLFVADLENRLRRIDKAISNQDYDQLSYHAAQLKRSTARMGFSHFSTLIGQLEARARAMHAPDEKMCMTLGVAAEQMFWGIIEQLQPPESGKYATV